MTTVLETRTNRTVTEGRYYPLGATLGAYGVNFALYSRNAREVYLLLFDRPDGDPTDVIRLENQSRYVWYAHVQGVKAGQLYGYKVRGEHLPARGLRFNENKLLADPYAKAFTGKFVNADNLLLAYDATDPAADLSRDARDDSRIVPKSIVVDDAFDWQGDSPLDYDLERLFIYEVHVKGFTAHPSSKAKSPGTYLGFIEKIPYLRALGINAVELLPVHEHYVEDALRNRGLTNYWGYNTVGFFAPESSYGTGRSPGCQVAEFKTLVRELHKAGIEVILDVVYNHTCEGNERGPTACFRGIDNPTYYLLTGPPSEPYRYYENYTGCGNTMNLADPHVIRFVMDSLRYWVETMHVDGFRFDLASVLGREAGLFEKSASFFDAITQDPVLNHVKLIAEPWDLGTYQVGNFPVDWSEWNGKFRDTVRRFVKGDAGQVRDLGWRLTGSADMYADGGRGPSNSVNFITCHDGFTLRDLVSYDGKHNDANGEENRDGTSDNNSWNCGVEGESDDPAVLALRARLVRNHICCLIFASGTPMILSGDELGRTQNGNNNAYCQDNALSWLDWTLAERNADLLVFCRKAIAFTFRYPILQRRKFFRGMDLDADGQPDINWFGADGGRPRWDDPELRTLCYQLDGSEAGAGGTDYLLFIILNADHRAQAVTLPPLPAGRSWRRAIDTSLPPGSDFADAGAEVPLGPADSYAAAPRSTVVLVG